MTVKLGLTDLANGQANYLNANASFERLNQIVQPVAVSRLATPPVSPENEALYIVIPTATGEWSGKEGKLAYWLTSVGAWQFITPSNGWAVWSLDDAGAYTHSGGSWFAAGTAFFAPVVIESTTSRTLSATDSGTYVRHTNSSASTVTVPPQASESWAQGTEINLRYAGTTSLTITPGAGVTLNAPSGGTLVLTLGMTATIKRVASDEWDVIGQTVPV